jgi:methylthioribose-1-phosphate isomerase
MTAVEAAAPTQRAAAAEREALALHAEDAAACLRIGALGAALFGGETVTLLTHCNTGALATGGIGTALGIVRTVHAQGRLQRVFACEARPVLQGARLTVWECLQDGLPVTLLPDHAAASLLAAGGIDGVVLGADRIAADGSVANKLGTYPLAVLAARHGVPFVSAAPVSTFDLACPSGSSIPIEQRDGEEVRRLGRYRVVDPAVSVYNPSFDVTPPELVTAIVCERGVVRPVDAVNVRRVVA